MAAKGDWGCRPFPLMQSPSPRPTKPQIAVAADLNSRYNPPQPAAASPLSFRLIFQLEKRELTETDVVPSTNIQYVCDGHDLPFESKTFDAVVLQAVLEHVIDPVRVVAEVRRVLRPCGLVYAETPFMQQVHAAALDFTRFTDLGHRRLFRYFEEIERGAASGPATALAWAIQHFMLAFSIGPRSRKLLTGFARLGLFWLKYFDYSLVHRKAGCDAASSLFFLGRKDSTAIDDRRLLELYRGAQTS